MDGLGVPSRLRESERLSSLGSHCVSITNGIRPSSFCSCCFRATCWDWAPSTLEDRQVLQPRPSSLTWKNHSEAMYTEHALVAQVRGARDLEEGKGWEKPSLRGGLLGE